MARNGGPACSGIGGRHGSEPVAGLDRNPQPGAAPVHADADTVALEQADKSVSYS